MFCANCGKQLGDRDLFCAECGTRVTVQAVQQPEPQPESQPVEIPEEVVEPVFEATTTPAETPVQTEAPIVEEPVFETPVVEVPVEEVVVQEPVIEKVPESVPEYAGPKTSKKKKKKGPARIILPIVAAVVVVAVLAVVVLGFVGGPAVKVGAAFANTMKEYAKVSETLGLPETETSTEIKPFTQTIEVELKEFPDMPEIEGFGSRISVGLNMEDKEMGIAVTPMYASMDVLDAQVLLKDDELYASIPQLTDGRAYMVNTETIGATLVDQGADPEMVDLSVNFFDLIEIIKENSQLSEKAQKKLNDAAADLLKEIEIEKDGNDTLEINDHDLKCVVYDVVIPDKAIIDYFEVIEDVYQDVDTNQLVVDIFEELGFPDYIVEEAMMAAEDVDISSAFEEIYMALEELGDIELQVGVHKGLVVYINWEVSVMDSEAELTVQLGGGKEYVDDICIALEADGGKIVLTSTGDHACSDGTFTDETTLEFISDYEEFAFTSSMEYKPKAKNDNFEWTINALDEKIYMSGHVSFGKDRTLLELDDVEIYMYGQLVMSMSLIMETGDYRALDMDTYDAVEIFTLSEDEMYEELMVIQESAMVWAEDLAASNPELVALLENMMY